MLGADAFGRHRSGNVLATPHRTYDLERVLRLRRLEISPLVAPIVLFPVGSRLLIEFEFELKGAFDDSDGQWNREYETAVEYLQVDVIVNRYLTVVAGRVLTPFGVFNERLHPSWIKKLQLNPLIFPIGTGSSNGLMLRGGAQISSGLDLS